MMIRSVEGANNTIIEGSQRRGMGSTIVIRPQSYTTHHPEVVIDGFRIMYGTGTTMDQEIVIEDGLPQTTEVNMGGGLFLYVNSSTVINS